MRTLCFFCFFFQAEDGIRDTSVTGVQTCALPIFSIAIERPLVASSVVAELQSDGHFSGQRVSSGAEERRGELGGGRSDRERRSEERRVGKEWRGRGWA